LGIQKLYLCAANGYFVCDVFFNFACLIEISSTKIKKNPQAEKKGSAWNMSLSEKNCFGSKTVQTTKSVRN
jgi:hypothetical protein